MYAMVVPLNSKIKNNCRKYFRQLFFLFSVNSIYQGVDSVVTLKKPYALPPFIIQALPIHILDEFGAISRNHYGMAEEIRIRRGRKIEFLFSGTSILGEQCIDGGEIQEIFYRLCEGSVYAHEETVCRGYIRAEGGVRIGICGSAVLNGDKVSAVHDICSINIRLPCTSLPDVSELADKLTCTCGGALLFSPPSGGKTTVLRALANDISGRLRRRVALIDSNGELSPGLDGEDMRIDILRGYPRAEGIEIAVRALNPQYIICDEIGSRGEASAILAARDCGVPIIASAHGECVDNLVKRIGINELHEAEIFENYVRLKRRKSINFFDYSVINRKDIGSFEHE